MYSGIVLRGGSKQLRHENLVNLLEVCKKKKRWYLVFEFVDHTVLDDLEQFPNGLDSVRVRKYLYQIIKGTGFCHSHNIIHRDIKPENILVSHSGIVKLCDFGFARTLAAPGEVYTEYVATRWYRAPELLVGDIKYGKAVDLWAIGCLVTEMLTGEPLFPGDSDIDQLYHIMKCLGNLTPRHTELFYKNPLFAGVRLPEIREAELLDRRYPKISSLELDLAKKCLQLDPDKRTPCIELLKHDLFNKDGFAERFPQELSLKIQKDARDNHFLPKKSKYSKKDKEEPLEERQVLIVQDFNNDAKIKDSKPLKVKLPKSDLEPTGTSERSSHFNSYFDSGGAPVKAIPQAPLKESSSSLDYPKNPAMQIPPLAHNLSAVASSMNITSGLHSYRPEEKSKKYISPFKKHGQLSPGSHYNLNVATSVANEKNLLQTNKKKWDFPRTDVRLPELNHSHLPELKGADIRNMKLIKKENRLMPDSRIPSLATLDLHNPSLALQQISGNSLQDSTDANFPRPRVEH